jgi:hypothetical protein
MLPDDFMNLAIFKCRRSGVYKSKVQDLLNYCLLYGGPWCLWTLSMPPASFHLSSAVNFRVPPIFSDNLGTPAYVGPVTDLLWDETAVKRCGATLNGKTTREGLHDTARSIRLTSQIGQFLHRSTDYQLPRTLKI